MINQKYRVGDLVEVVNLPTSKSHFDTGKAIVSESKHNTCQEGSDYEWSYSLIFIIDGVYSENNKVSWYHHSNLAILQKGLAHSFNLEDDK